MSKCPECGRFLKGVTATVNGFDEIKEVNGSCAKHGVVKTDDWAWDDFFNYDEPTSEEDDET